MTDTTQSQFSFCFKYTLQIGSRGKWEFLDYLEYQVRFLIVPLHGHLQWETQQHVTGTQFTTVLLSEPSKTVQPLFFAGDSYWNGPRHWWCTSCTPNATYTGNIFSSPRPNTSNALWKDYKWLFPESCDLSPSQEEWESPRSTESKTPLPHLEECRLFLSVSCRLTK